MQEKPGAEGGLSQAIALVSQEWGVEACQVGAYLVHNARTNFNREQVVEAMFFEDAELGLGGAGFGGVEGGDFGAGAFLYKGGGDGALMGQGTHAEAEVAFIYELFGEGLSHKAIGVQVTGGDEES